MSQVKSRHSGVAKGKERLGFVFTSELIRPILAEASQTGEIGSHFVERLLADAWTRYQKKRAASRN